MWLRFLREFGGNMIPPSEDGLIESFEPQFIRNTYPAALNTRCPLMATHCMCDVGFSHFLSDWWGRSAIPLDRWSETGRLFIDLMLAALALGMVQHHNRGSDSKPLLVAKRLMTRSGRKNKKKICCLDLKMYTCFAVHKLKV